MKNKTIKTYHQTKLKQHNQPKYTFFTWTGKAKTIKKLLNINNK